jgi:hypothetical protein
MKVPVKFVSKLNKDQIQQLKQLWLNGSSARVCKRAHGILLSSKKYSIDDIADILEVHKRLSIFMDSHMGTRWNHGIV